MVFFRVLRMNKIVMGLVFLYIEVVVFLEIIFEEIVDMLILIFIFGFIVVVILVMFVEFVM